MSGSHAPLKLGARVGLYRFALRRVAGARCSEYHAVEGEHLSLRYEGTLVAFRLRQRASHGAETASRQKGWLLKGQRQPCAASS